MNPSNDSAQMTEEGRQALYRLQARNDQRRRDILNGKAESDWQIELRTKRETLEAA